MCTEFGIIPAFLRDYRISDVDYYFQPVFDVRSGGIAKAELLLRAKGPAGNLLDSESVVSAAERTGAIHDLDEMSFRYTCKVLPLLKAKGIRQISVNLSPASCGDPKLVSRVARILRKTNTAPRDICVEITESAKVLNEASFIQAVTGLYDLGLSIAIDDFGKGYSGLARMTRMPFHILKIDKSFVWGMEEQPLTGPLLESVIAFAGRHRIDVVAEGVETIDQMRRLTDMGCRLLQGYYFSRPLPRERFFALLDQQLVERGIKQCW